MLLVIPCDGDLGHSILHLRLDNRQNSSLRWRRFTSQVIFLLLGDLGALPGLPLELADALAAQPAVLADEAVGRIFEGGNELVQVLDVRRLLLKRLNLLIEDFQQC